MNSRPRLKVTWARLIATVACLAALTAYGTLEPATSSASGACYCKYAGANYSEGACVGNQRCICTYTETGCSICRWFNDPEC